MLVVVLLALPAATAVLLALAARVGSLVSTLLIAYLALVGNIGLLTWLLSPLHLVTRVGLAVAQTVLLGLAVAIWWLRGAPRPSLAGAAATVRSVALDPVTGGLLAFLILLLSYELILALGAPANNWDSLTYHLPRAVAWMQHGGIYEIPNVPSSNFNEFPPLAEQQILYGFVATSSGALFALPQYLAELAVLTAVYGTSRRLGFPARAATAAAVLFATFSFVALQATTAQNDLFAASFPVVAACLLLGEQGLELVAAGTSAGMGLGAKPTTALVLPVLVLLAFLRGRRRALLALAGGVAGFVAVGMWSYVLNLVHTGHLAGREGWTSIGDPSQQSIKPGSLSTFVDVLYQTLDLSVLSDRMIHALALLGAVAAVAVAATCLFRGGAVHRAVIAGAAVAVPFFAPLIVIGASGVVAWIARDLGFPVRGHLGNVGTLNRSVTGGAFGPVGAVLLIAVPLVTVCAFALRRADARRLALALALPVFFFFLSQAQYNWFLTRFLLIPAALTAPLFAGLLRSRRAIAAYGVVGALVAVLVVTRDPQRPLHNAFGRPWLLSQVQALDLSDLAQTGTALAAYDRLVPGHACVGAVLDPNEPAFLLAGPRLDHRVDYLPVNGALDASYHRHLSYVVITRGTNAWAARQFAGDGWTIKPLGSYWRLAVARHAGDGRCE
jgi:hypothetical protein